jgi:hypothetical protein
MEGSKYKLMKKLIIVIGIIAAILAILIPFSTKNRLQKIPHVIKRNAGIITLEFQQSTADKTTPLIMSTHSRA